MFPNAPRSAISKWFKFTVRPVTLGASIQKLAPRLKQATLHLVQANLNVENVFSN
jgi:hypothetical protein